MTGDPRLRRAAAKLLERGWVSIPLGLDGNGKPKRPLPQRWPDVRKEIVMSLMWPRAEGLGIVLGPVSGNLAVIDIDDNVLAKDVFAFLSIDALRTKELTRMCWTGRKNLHVYVYEGVASSSTSMRVTYKGIPNISVELKCQGTQVAAPPTPGYAVATPNKEPVLCDSIADYWEYICAGVGIDAPEKGSAEASGNFPKPWAETVEKGDRNKAIYVEACTLRDAHMPLATAIQTMNARVATAYQSGDLNRMEVERTVRSAYRRDALPEAGPRKGKGRKWE